MIRYETEKIISHYDFLAMSENADKSKSIIKKIGFAFCTTVNISNWTFLEVRIA